MIEIKDGRKLCDCMEQSGTHIELKFEFLFEPLSLSLSVTAASIILPEKSIC